MRNPDTDSIIWTPTGAWYQHTDKHGVDRISYLGRQDREEMEEFCARKGIEFSEYLPGSARKLAATRPRATFDGRPAATLNSVQSAWPEAKRQTV